MEEENEKVLLPLCMYSRFANYKESYWDLPGKALNPAGPSLSVWYHLIGCNLGIAVTGTFLDIEGAFYGVSFDANFVK